jgi:hypothetical protein
VKRHAWNYERDVGRSSGRYKVVACRNCRAQRRFKGAGLVYRAPGGRWSVVRPVCGLGPDSLPRRVYRLLLRARHALRFEPNKASIEVKELCRDIDRMLDPGGEP